MNNTSYDQDTPVDLSRFDDDYRRAKQGDLPAYKPVPDGKYQVVVENVELTRTRTTGNPMLKWRLRIAGPVSADRLLWKNQVITDRTMLFLTKEFQTCGLNMDSLSELPGKLPTLVNLRLEVTKRSRVEGPDDIFIERNLSAGAPVKVAARQATTPEESIDEHDEFNEDINDDLPF